MRSYIGIWLVGLVLAGCVSFGQSQPEKHYYALEAVREGKRLVALPGTTLNIRRFRASPPFEGRELVYRESDARYERDFYNEWVVPPDVMLTQQTLNWLTAAGLFQYLTDSSGPLPATHILEGTVTALYGDYRATPLKVVLGLQFVLMHDTAASTDMIWHDQYRKEVEVGEQSPEALVSGWNDALRIILTAVEADMNQALRPR
jgi:uncharacterized lipoprotein YmbA